VRSVHIAFLLAAVIVGVGTWQPAVANACSGRHVTLRDAVRASDGAVYAGRITEASPTEIFWVSIRIDIDHVLNGRAASRVERAQAGSVCDGIQVGQYGIVVRGIREPLSDNPDLFFAMTRSEAEAALRSLAAPDTSTAPEAPGPADTSPAWAWVIGWTALAVAIALRLRLRPRA
jgi:hypothetical protein